MRNIAQEELKKILEKHLKFTKSEEGGEYADLSDTDLSGADLRRADLRSSNLRNADLSGADLRSSDLSDADLSGADLRSSDLSDADLSGADLRSSDLRNADLRSADLRSANLRNADLRNADLSGADLSCANLSGANLSGANLKNIFYDEYTTFFAMCCPEEGAFVGFKRCKNNLIVKLLITEESKRSSATTRKCRCSEAKVLEILTTEGKKAVERKAVSIIDENFVYEVGKTVFVKNFCEDRWEECAAGIHFFLTFDEAVKYNG